MTEAQAWRKIAERLSDPNYYFTGLCYEINNLWVPFKVWASMVQRISNHRSDYTWRSYVYPAAEFREARILAALWMAHESEEEGS